jgi:hypothetical protein
MSDKSFSDYDLEKSRCLCKVPTLTAYNKFYMGKCLKVCQEKKSGFPNT